MAFFGFFTCTWQELWEIIWKTKWKIAITSSPRFVSLGVITKASNGSTGCWQYCDTRSTLLNTNEGSVQSVRGQFREPKVPRVFRETRGQWVVPGISLLPFNRNSVYFGETKNLSKVINKNLKSLYNYNLTGTRGQKDETRPIFLC